MFTHICSDFSLGCKIFTLLFLLYSVFKFKYLFAFDNEFLSDNFTRNYLSTQIAQCHN